MIATPASEPSPAVRPFELDPLTVAQARASSLRLETYDRMMGHAIEYLGGQLAGDNDCLEKLHKAASEMTDRALKKYMY
ncbi:MAG: hypothetical protein RR280_04440 [Bacteroidaceae bacterium]